VNLLIILFRTVCSVLNSCYSMTFFSFTLFFLLFNFLFFIWLQNLLSLSLFVMLWVVFT